MVEILFLNKESVIIHMKSRFKRSAEAYFQSPDGAYCV